MESINGCFFDLNDLFDSFQLLHPHTFLNTYTNFCYRYTNKKEGGERERRGKKRRVSESSQSACVRCCYAPMMAEGQL